MLEINQYLQRLSLRQFFSIKSIHSSNSNLLMSILTFKGGCFNNLQIFSVFCFANSLYFR